MRAIKLILVLVGLCLALSPFLLLIILGFYEIVQSDYLLYWFLGSSTCLALAWLIWATIARPPKASRHANELDQALIVAESYWNSRDYEAWNKVRQTALNYERQGITLEDENELFMAFIELTNLVAQHYKPNIKDPVLEITFSDLLLVLENACNELRTKVVESIPLHHLITLGDMLRARHATSFANKAFTAYRLIRTVSNPIGAIIAEAQGFLSKRAIDDVVTYSQSWLLARSLEGVGKHLINLYSGNAVGLLNLAPREHAIVAHSSPLNILLFGQTNAGKSSLVNALFGDLVAPTLPIPYTDHTLVYEKIIDPIGKLYIFDTQGYGQSKTSLGAQEEIKRLLPQTDLLILVTPANEASRRIDAQMLKMLDLQKLETAPPLLIALTKIDKLRPLKEWNPPYDLSRPTHGSKGATIREATLTVAEDLNVPPESVVPIMLRSEDSAYNVDILLLLMAELLPEAKCSMLRRAIKKYKEQQYWENLKSSFANSGRIAISCSLDYATRRIRDIIDIAR